MNNKHLVLFTAVMACGSHLGASALTIASATYLTDATYMSNFTTGAHVTDETLTPGTSSELGATATLTVAPAVVLSAQASYQGTNTRDGAEATLDYYFAVSGPLGGAPVPVIIDFNLSASSHGDIGVGTGGDDTIMFDYRLDSTYHDLQRQDVDCPAIGTCLWYSGSDSVTTHVPLAYDAAGFADLSTSFYVSLQAGEVHDVYLDVNVGSGIGGVATAYADPYIYIDPSFPGAASYSIVQSAGVGNGLPGSVSASPAPEPASFALIGVALIGAGLLKRRKLNRA